uniref:Uncharacterized protein n=1 Tax=Arundo donax TaxID=35708 RepID=A0A0A9DNZ5_ARUDO
MGGLARRVRVESRGLGFWSGNGG